MVFLHFAFVCFYFCFLRSEITRSKTSGRQRCPTKKGKIFCGLKENNNIVTVDLCTIVFPCIKNHICRKRAPIIDVLILAPWTLKSFRNKLISLGNTKETQAKYLLWCLLKTVSSSRVSICNNRANGLGVDFNDVYTKALPKHCKF